MIESGVEVHFIVLIITFYFNLSELAIPVCFCFRQVFVEVIFGDFSLQVFGCSFHTDTGNGSVYQYLFILLGIEIEAGDNSGTETFVVFDDGSCVQFHFLKRPGESGAEIDVLIACPAVGETVTLNGDGVYDFDMRIVGKIPVHGFLQI